MFKKLILLKNNDFDSSYDSTLSDKNEITVTKTDPNKNATSNVLDLANYSVDYEDNKLIKEKLQKRLKDNSNLFNKTTPVNWRNFYENFVNESVKKDQINIKELELRINSVLNKYDEKKDRMLKMEKIENNTNSSNNLLYKNKYMQGDKLKFIQVIMSKYNEFDINTMPNNRKASKKKVKTSRNLDNRMNENTTLLTNLTKASTTADQKSIRANTRKRTGNRRSIKSESEAKRHFMFKDVVTKLTKHPLHNPNSDRKGKFNLNYSKENSLNKNESDIQIAESHKKLKSELHFEVTTAKKFLENIRSMEKTETIKFEKADSEEKKKKTIPLAIAKLIKSSKLLETAISNTIIAQKKEDLDNITHDIKSYEKELNKTKDLFTLPNNRGLQHFFAFDSLQDGIRVSKAVRKFNAKEKLEENKKKIDFIIGKILK